MFDVFKMLGKLNEVKGRMQQVKERLALVEVEEYSDDRLIRVVVTGDRKIRLIDINESLLNPQGKADLENKLLATINTALDKAEKNSKAELKKEFEGILPDIPGFDVENLPL